MSVEAVTPVTVRFCRDVKITNEIIIGKDILELVSGAMYVNPLNIYREYVQNSADAIDQAISDSLISHATIEIVVRLNARTATIRDNGIGVANKDFIKMMTAIGGSLKRAKREARGFRGVGRLAGLSYCRNLRFRSKALGDSKFFEINWDCLKFKQILRDPSYEGGLDQVIKDVTSIQAHPAGEEAAFFEVELSGILRLKNDMLLNGKLIGDYLSQVAPVSFHPDFKHGSEIETRMRACGISPGYPIQLTEPDLFEGAPAYIFRQHRNEFVASGGNIDVIQSVTHFELTGLDGDLCAIGWIADHKYYGAIPSSELLKGIRLRSGNMQIGESDITANLFPEPRFNSWAIGEIHVLSHKIVPNGRRDNFEEDTHYDNLLSQLQPYTTEIARICRSKSSRRQWTARFQSRVARAHEDLKLISSGALAKRKRSVLESRVASEVIDLETLIKSSKYEWTQELLPELAKLKAKLTRLRNRTIKVEDPLASVPRSKRFAFQEVLSLVYESIPSKDFGNAIVEKITKKLADKYG